MTDVCLVIPPSIFLLDERVFASLGILKVASSLEAAGHRVEVLDLSGIANYEEVAALHARGSRSTVFGITTTTPQMPATTKVLAAIRKVRADARVIIGGPHPTLIAAARRMEAKRGTVARGHAAFDVLMGMFDAVVSGDGELAIHEALTTDGFIDADDPKGPLFLTNATLEETAWPARHLIDLGSYHYDVHGYNATSLIAQLGCPFKCSFCGGRNSSMLRRIRTRSTESIVDELEHLHRTYGYRGFMFYDDELNVNKDIIQLMDGISNLQERLGVDFRLRGFVKSELFTPEQAQSMYRAGFRQLLTGFESGSERILLNINKKATRDENTRCVDTARAAGLKVKALMSVGHAGESLETVEATRDWLLEVQPEDFDCTVITTYPGTPYYDEAVNTSPNVWTYTAKNGDRLHARELDYNTTADYYKGAPDGGYAAYVFTDHITSDDLVRARDDLEREVRAKLSIPFNQSAVSVNFEHSMGQGPALPPSILRTSDGSVKRVVRLSVVR
jgi:radical SAM superfamily enzyme YgiQ (UPF0313 family)